MLYIIDLLILILGLSFGSFLTVVIHRLDKKMPGIILGQSICPNCKKKLSPIDLIPVFSYIFLKGKCRQCKKRISAFYPILELTTGLAFLAAFQKFPFIYFQETTADLIINYSNLLNYITVSIVLLFLISIVFFDIKYKRIPDVLLFPLIAITLIGNLLTGSVGIIEMIEAALIPLIFFGGQILISKGKWLGEGDLYLGISMALLLGINRTILAIILSYFVGTIIALSLLANKKTKLKAEIAFAPFLVIGTFISLFFGSEIISFYTQKLLLF